MYLFFSLRLASQETTPEVQKFILAGKEPAKFQIELLESFMETPYRYQRSISHLQDLKYTGFLPKSPDFEYEEKSLPGLLKVEDQKSLQIQTTLEIPSREKLFLEPTEPKRITSGYPFRISLWVHSNFYKGRLYVRFNSKEYGNLKIELGDLDFSGWKRLEASFPLLRKQRDRDPQKMSFHFQGIGADFSKAQPPTPFLIHLDRMMVLVEKYEVYPGSEIEDGWRFR
jgi:hypothetical protein